LLPESTVELLNVMHQIGSWRFPSTKTDREKNAEQEAARLEDGLPVPRESVTNSGKPNLLQPALHAVREKCGWLPIAPNREHESNANLILVLVPVNSDLPRGSDFSVRLGTESIRPQAGLV
jgi:hypothetical protein